MSSIPFESKYILLEEQWVVSSLVKVFDGCWASDCITEHMRSSSLFCLQVVGGVGGGWGEGVSMVDGCGYIKDKWCWGEADEEGGVGDKNLVGVVKGGSVFIEVVAKVHGEEERGRSKGMSSVKIEFWFG